MATLHYYFVKKNKIELVKFEKYTIDNNGVIANKAFGNKVNTYKNKEGYNKCCVYDNSGKQRGISIGRAIASTYHGVPPTPKHTADHVDRNRDSDTIDNIKWSCKTGQRENQIRPETHKSASIIVKDDVEKTAKEWVEHLKDEKTPSGRKYTTGMIFSYAQKKKHGFLYKEYPDIINEVWKEIVWSKTKMGRWEISNMCRVKYITKYAENVFSEERLCKISGYPTIGINGQNWHCHILAFATFFPEDYTSKKHDEIVKHIGDDKLDFRPHMLQIGTKSENQIESHINGKRDGTKTARMKCSSYIDDIFEKEYESQHDAVRYLITHGYDKASSSQICQALKAYKDDKVIIRYDRTWKLVA